MSTQGYPETSYNLSVVKKKPRLFEVEYNYSKVKEVPRRAGYVQAGIDKKEMHYAWGTLYPAPATCVSLDTGKSWHSMSEMQDEMDEKGHYTITFQDGEIRTNKQSPGVMYGRDGVWLGDE